jgi:hypothetical protein
LKENAFANFAANSEGSVELDIEEDEARYSDNG